jgi:hypothetical protein
MKTRFFLSSIFFLLFTHITFGQTTSTVSDYTGYPHWLQLGYINMPQGGNDAYIKIIGGDGYNASTSQDGYLEVHLRTSNGISVDGNGFGFAATATAYGRGGSFISQVTIVPNTNGANATVFTVYVYWGQYAGNSFYSVQSSSTATWTSTNAVSSTAPVGYVVPFEYFLYSNAYLMDPVGINTTWIPSGYQMVINGSVLATSLTVQSYLSWPDYVFKPSYTLPTLTEVKTYIDQTTTFLNTYGTAN